MILELSPQIFPFFGSKPHNVRIHAWTDAPEINSFSI